MSFSLMLSDQTDMAWWQKTWHKPRAIAYRACDVQRPGHRREELLKRLWKTFIGDELTDWSDWPNSSMRTADYVSHKACIVWRVADIIDPVADSFGCPAIFACLIDSYFDAFGGALTGTQDFDPMIAKQRWRMEARNIIGLDMLPRERWEKSL